MKPISLAFPEKALEQHLVALGKTGSGKSSTLRHIVEHLLGKKKRVCVIDPKGDWWGLKSSSDGKGAGFPIITFGDFKEGEATDIPLNAQSGKHVAELITSGNRPCVIGFRGWTASDMRTFWIDFAASLFNSNSAELYVVVDEVHNFAPKGKILDPKAGEMLHWTNRLLSEGRGLGLVFLIASQRPQKVHNDTLTCCETLVALRVAHAADRGAVKDWIDGCGDKAQGTEVLNNLAQLSRGEAFVWSPEIGYGPKRIKFPKFVTFDSFAPPQLQQKVSMSGWADVNLDAVKDKLAKVIEEAEANDPKKLKARIKQLERDVTKPAPRSTVVHSPDQQKLIADLQKQQKTQLAKVKIFIERADKTQAAAIKKVNEAVKSLMDIQVGFSSFLDGLAGDMNEGAKIARHAESPVLSVREPKPLKIASSGEGSPELGKGSLRKILTILAQHSGGLSDGQIGIFTGVKSTTGSFKTYLSTLRNKGWISGDRNLLKITDEGIEALGEYEELPSGAELREYWSKKLGTGAVAKIFNGICESYPNSISDSEIAAEVGISHETGSFKTYLSTLRSMQLIEGKRDALIASGNLFD